MTYARCKCGKSEFWGSGMDPSPCASCSDCGSNIAYTPDQHVEPQPHDFSFKEAVDTDAGPATISRCRWCLRTPKQIACAAEAR